jgi:phosphate/sulfate permease
MDKGIGVGLIIGAVTGSSIYIWNSGNYSKTQKIILLICILFPPLQWILAVLMYFYNKSISTGKINFSEFSIGKSQHSQSKKSNLSIKEQKQGLDSLKNKGILTSEEYEEKIHKIEFANRQKQAKNTNEYKQLTKLFENDILSKEEFELKSQEFINDYHKNFEKENIRIELEKTENEKIEFEKRSEGLTLGWKIFYFIASIYLIGIIMYFYFKYSKGYNKKAKETLKITLYGILAQLIIGAIFGISELIKNVW